MVYENIPWLESRVAVLPTNQRIREAELKEFDEEGQGDRRHYLNLLGQYLDMDNPTRIETIPQLRKKVRSEGRVFPSNAGSYKNLIPITRGVIEKGIDYFPKKERIKRKGKKKSKLDYATILERAERCESISKIAQDAGISRSRVRQIIKSEFLQFDTSEMIH